MGGYCPDPYPHTGPHGWNWGASFERPFTCPGRPEEEPLSVALDRLMAEAEGMTLQRGADLGGRWTVLALVIVCIGIAILLAASLS